MRVIWQVAAWAALAGLVGCASNPPKDPKFPPQCEGAYTPINALTHYSESALRDHPELLDRRAQALRDNQAAAAAEKQP